MKESSDKDKQKDQHSDKSSELSGISGISGLSAISIDEELRGLLKRVDDALATTAKSCESIDIGGPTIRNLSGFQNTKDEAVSSNSKHFGETNEGSNVEEKEDEKDRTSSQSNARSNQEFDNMVQSVRRTQTRRLTDSCENNFCQCTESEKPHHSKAYFLMAMKSRKTGDEALAKISLEISAKPSKASPNLKDQMDPSPSKKLLTAEGDKRALAKSGIDSIFEGHDEHQEMMSEQHTGHDHDNSLRPRTKAKPSPFVPSFPEETGAQAENNPMVSQVKSDADANQDNIDADAIKDSIDADAIKDNIDGKATAEQDIPDNGGDLKANAGDGSGGSSSIYSELLMESGKLGKKKERQRVKELKQLSGLEKLYIHPADVRHEIGNRLELCRTQMTKIWARSEGVYLLLQLLRQQEASNKEEKPSMLDEAELKAVATAERIIEDIEYKLDQIFNNIWHKS